MNALLLVIVAGLAFLAAYHTYGRWVARRVFQLREDTLTPAVLFRDNKDYCPTKKAVIFGHHFTSIAGTGPIVGPAIAVMWGWLPAIIWVVFGAIFIGAVHDLGSLVVSLRNKGRTIGDVAGDLLGPRVRLIFLGVLVMGLWIVLAIFGLVIAAVLKQYPAAIFPVVVQVPLAVGIGWVVHRRGGSILIPSIVALAVMYATVVFGDADFGPTIANLHAFNQFLAAQPTWVWVVGLLAYSYVASVLPVWVLLQPRDYINALQLLSALGLLIAGLVTAAAIGGMSGVGAGSAGVAVVAGEDAGLGAPVNSGEDARAEARGSEGAVLAPAVAGRGERVPLEIVAPVIDLHPPGAPPLIPILFITIACGAISGFHCLVSSGTTSKQIAKETDALPVGFGSMLTEGLLATLVIVACAAGLGLGVTKDIWFTGTSDSGDGTYKFGSLTVPRVDGDRTAISIRARVGQPEAQAQKPIEIDDSTVSVVVRTGRGLEYHGFSVSVVDDVWSSAANFGTSKEFYPGIDHALGENLRAIEVDGETITLDPQSWTYHVEGRLAFDKQYESWASAGSLSNMVGAFVDGAANLIKSMGVPAGMAVALMGVLVASFAGTTMDTACRLQRYVIQELARTFLPRTAEGACAACGYDLSGLTTGIDAGPDPVGARAAEAAKKCPECGAMAKHADRADAHAGLAAARAMASNWNPFKWLATAHGATMFAVVTAALLAAVPAPGQALSLENAGKGGLILWPLFGATNQLLAGMAFVVIAAWLIAKKRPVWFVIAPTAIMIVLPAWALVWQAFVGGEGNPAWLADRKWLLVAVATATLALEAWLVCEVVARMLNRKKAESPPRHRGTEGHGEERIV